MNTHGPVLTTPIIEADLLEDLRTELLVRLQSEGYDVPGTDLRDVVRWWCNVRRRRIERRPRRLIRSRELQARALPPAIARGLRRVEKVVVDGRNLNPHLSRKRLDADFSDALLDMWGIHHLHLGLKLPRSSRRFRYAATFSNFSLMNFNSNSIGLT